jgi:6,7-dimethyl-8-ribityllumazine synthase
VSGSEDRFSGQDPFDDMEGWPYREAPSSPRSREREAERPFDHLAEPEPESTAPEPSPDQLEPELEQSPVHPSTGETALAETRVLDEAEIDVEPEPEPSPGVEPEPEAAVDVESESEPEAAADVEPESPAGGEPEPEPLAGGEPEPEPLADVEPESEAGVQPEPEPVPDLVGVAPVVVPDDEEAVQEEQPAEVAAPDEAAVLDEDVPDVAPEHAEGGLDIPAGHVVVEGGPNGFRRTVAVVIARFNGDLTNRLLASALDALEDAHVAKDAITVVPVPGAFELPLAAMALAKTRRFACVVALGCVIRGETPHFDFVAGEAASGLQLAAIETGIPVSFGVLTCETIEQAEARVGKGAEAARAALEMADLFTQVRTRAAG